jgi:hypothetical protein
VASYVTSTQTPSWESWIRRRSGVATTLASRFLKPGLGTAIFGARVLFAFAMPSLVFVHEAHPAAQAAAVVRDESSFLKEIGAATTKVMNDMAAKPTGDIDRDFVAMMNPHLQDAIDMAVLELRYGKNEQLRRIAQETIIDQMQEIAVMKLAIGEPMTDSAPAPTQAEPAAAASEHHHSGMRMDMSAGMKK